MIDLNDDGNIPIVVNTVGRFVNQARQMRGCCGGCHITITDFDSVKVMAFMNKIHIFCSRCGEHCASVTILDSPEEFPFAISEDETQAFTRMLNSSEFEMVLQNHIQERFGFPE